MNTYSIDTENIGDQPPLRVDLSGLNPAQYEAVTTTEGPVLVIAGAGSGKTRTLVYRVAYLLEAGVSPDSILLLTFTRKASQEMLWRAGELVQNSCARVMGGTFHGVANMLLRRYGANMWWKKGFTIIDRADAEGIINLLKSSLQLGKGDKRFPSKRVVINIISGSVNKGLDLEVLVDEQYPHLLDHLQDILILAGHYATFKRDNALMDYDDLLVNWTLLLREDVEARRAMSHRFRYVMVDEYQDTNLVQAEIIRLLATEHDNVMVVGDDSQSIYSFRGADFYNIMRFPQDFAGTKIIKLEQNYRSTQPILSLTNDIIANATEKYTKSLFTKIEGSQRPLVHGARDEQGEAAFILSRIREHLAAGIEVENIAVLFRSGFHSYKLEIGLASAGIHFEKRGGVKLTEAAHMKDVLSFLRLLVNPRDNLSWNRVLLQLDRIGPKTAQKITAAIVTGFEPFLALRNYPAPKAAQTVVAELAELLQALQQPAQKPIEQYERVLAYYQPILERLYSDDFPKREKDLNHFRETVAGYETLQELIDDITLDPPESPVAQPQLTERMILSTIHSSKGLEFDVVFVMGLAEGRFPSGQAGFGPQLEEERRLLYVAATRARKHLYLTYPRQMMTPDRQFKRVGMSPYLVEIKDHLYQRAENSVPSRREPAKSRPTLPSAPRKAVRRGARRADLSAGKRVKHPFFGVGVVTKMTGGNSVEVFFDEHGNKALHLDYAKLEVVS